MSLEVAAGDSAVAALTVGLSEQDFASMRWIFKHSNWQLFRTADNSESMRFLSSHRVGIVLVPKSVADGEWHNLQDRIQSLPCPPLLIVIADESDEKLWADALNGGAYDVLCRPFDAEEAVHILSLAWLHWKEQMATRWSRSGTRPGKSGAA